MRTRVSSAVCTLFVTGQRVRARASYARGPRNVLGCGLSRIKRSIHYAIPRSINGHSRQESTVESWEALSVAYIDYPAEGSSPVFARRPPPRSPPVMFINLIWDCGAECRTSNLLRDLRERLAEFCTFVFRILSHDKL